MCNSELASASGRQATSGADLGKLYGSFFFFAVKPNRK